MGSEDVVRREELKKLWAFGKNNSTRHWADLRPGTTAGELREGRAANKSFPWNPPPRAIPDCAVFNLEDFSFEWLEIVIQARPDTPDMEMIAWASAR